MKSANFLRGLLVTLLGIGSCYLKGQQRQSPAQAAPSNPSIATQPATQEVPWTINVRKTVVFLKSYFRDRDSQTEAAGTGFFIVVPDPRLGENAGFEYLVTNRHMADPSVVVGHAVQILGYSLQVNRVNETGSGPSLVSLPIAAGPWFFPDDPSVDLAVLPLYLDPTKFDYLPISIRDLATEDQVKKENITEGDSVIFAGFFAQFPGQQRIEPVLREGLLAMMPEEPIPTTLNRPRKIYLADMHSFHGNSGSPVFVNLAGFRNGSMVVGVRLLLLGVLSGYMYESADLKLETATTYIGSVGANSGITTIVPAQELKKLLDSLPLSQLRDSAAKGKQK